MKITRKYKPSPKYHHNDKKFTKTVLWFVSLLYNYAAINLYF